MSRVGKRHLVPPLYRARGDDSAAAVTARYYRATNHDNAMIKRFSALFTTGNVGLETTKRFGEGSQWFSLNVYIVLALHAHTGSRH